MHVDTAGNSLSLTSSENKLFISYVRKIDEKIVVKAKNTANENYTVQYSKGCKAVGQYKVNIIFKGNYSGTVIKSYKIIPKGTSLSKLTGGKKKVSVKWKKQMKEISGYQKDICPNFQAKIKKDILYKNTDV